MQAVLGETYEVQTAADGKTALELVSSIFLPDLILLDVKMPGIDGYEVCRQFKLDEKTRDIPIIFLTSLAADEDQTQGLDLGAVDFIMKPSEFSLIKRRIQTHLELKRHRDQLQNLVDQKIQELDLVEKSKREKDSFLQGILMSVPVAVGFIVDRKMVWTNQRTAEITGYTCAELEGQSTRLLYPSDEVYAKIGDVYTEIQKTGFGSFNSVWRIKSGVDIDVHFNAAALDKTDLSVGVIFAALDISERKQAEKTLRISEKRLKYAQQVAKIGNWELNHKTGFLYWSDEIYRIFDLSSQQFSATYEAFLDVIHPDDREFVDNVYAQSLIDKSPYKIEHRLLLKDGSIKYVNEKCNTEFDADGFPVISFGTVHDITENKQAEDALRRSEDKFSQIFKLSPDAITLSRLSDGVFLEVNQVFTDLSGWSAQEALGRRSLDLGLWCFAEDRERMTAGLCEHGEVRNLEVVLRHKRGHTTKCLISARLIKIGEEDCFLSITRDMTEQRQLEEEASRANRLAALGELAAGVAHEINNPNALILYNSEILAAVLEDLLPWLKEKQSDTSGQLFGGLSYQDAIQEIPVLLPAVHDSAHRIKRIVNDLRDFARQDSPDIAELINLNHVVQAAVRLVNSAIKKSTDYFELNLAETLPAVTGVTGRLEQVVINLLLNACQALENRTQKISLTTVYAADIDRLKVIVADEGQGMSAEVAEHIFEPFVTTKRDQGGTGLGLSVSARIVKEHHGELNFNSSPGQGTTVTLSLPIRKETDDVS